MLIRLIMFIVLGMVAVGSFPGQAWSQAQKSLADASCAQDLKDFGASGIKVLSVKTLDAGKLNTEIQEAAARGEAWPKEAVPVALRFVGPGLKGHTKIIEVRTPPEERHQATITVTESGYLDDAVGGERWRLWLAQGADGVWTMKRALWAQLCQRPGRTFYSSERCP